MKGVNQNLIIIVLLLSVFSCVKFEKADLVIHNARIYTVNETFEVAQAMAITNGIIVAIGKEHEIMNKYRASEIFDAETRPIYPGFVDVIGQVLSPDNLELIKKQKKNALRNSEAALFSKGITTVSYDGLTQSDLELINMMQNSGTLDMRIYAQLFPNNETLSIDAIFEDKLTVNSYKLALDGSLMRSKDSLAKIARLAYEKGFQLNVQAMGDSAVKVALEEMGKILKETNGMTWRIEHAQTVNESDIPMFKEFNIIPSVDPMNKLKVENASFWLKSLLNQNQIIALEMEKSLANKNPVNTFFKAVTSSNTNESISREEALKGITFWPALANKEYEVKGTLEVGKFADFVLLNRDIMKIPEEEINEAEVVFTFLGGQIVFEIE